MEFQPEIMEKLKTYQALLTKWQQKINLVSPTTIDNAWERHFLDSTQLSAILPVGAKILFDLGCGAGFPGLVLAMTNADITVHLIESDQKKCSFMKAVSRETGTKATVHNCRIEAFDGEIIPDIITARALAGLPKLFDYCKGWIAQNPRICLIFLKGQRADAELALIEKTWNFDVEPLQSQTERGAKILKFTNITPKQ